MMRAREDSLRRALVDSVRTARAVEDSLLRDSMDGVFPPPEADSLSRAAPDSAAGASDDMPDSTGAGTDDRGLRR